MSFSSYEFLSKSNNYVYIELQSPFLERSSLLIKFTVASFCPLE